LLLCNHATTGKLRWRCLNTPGARPEWYYDFDVRYIGQCFSAGEKVSDKTIALAEEATKQIESHALKAAEVLSQGSDGRIMVNSLGILSNPSSRGSDLRIARDEIEKALQIIEATTWPTEADYAHI
jgi:hypothetical protein